MFSPVYISDIDCITPLAENLDDNWHALLNDRTGIQTHDVGNLKAILTSKITDRKYLHPSVPFLENLLTNVGRSLLVGKRIDSRVGFILSTTKGSVEALKDGKSQEAELFHLADTVSKKLGISTKPIVVSHACVSGLLAVIAAKRFIQMGRFDEVLVLAGDQVSEFVVSGFKAFQAMSDEPCRPFDKHRSGVSLGEAVAGAWVTKEKEGASVEILGEGAINDANHISGPSRTGEGLVLSIQAALKEAALHPEKIDFISAHGTATLYNDEMEAIAFDRIGLIDKPTTSLKGYYGHTLGASGLLELVISIQALLKDTLIPTRGFNEDGTSRPINIVKNVVKAPLSIVLKTASGFGGSNAAVIIKKV